MKEDREESTRIRSQSELDAMVRKSRSESVPEEDIDDNNDDFEEHTKVGKLDELVARTKAAPATQTSANVIRRGSSPVMVAPPRAVGSQTDIREDKRDEDAFEEFDEPAETAQTFGDTEKPLPLRAPPVSTRMPALEQSSMPVVRSNVRWGVIAWFALLALMIGIGSVGYLRIKQLESQLAAAQIKK